MSRPVRVISLSTAATTFITLGLSPLSTVPVSKADGEDVILEQILNSLSAVDPTAALDMVAGSPASTPHCRVRRTLTRRVWPARYPDIDSALQGVTIVDPSSVAGAMPDIDSALQGVTVVDPSSVAGAMPDIDSALQGVTVVDPSSVAGAMPDIDSALQGVTVVDPSSVAGAMPDIDSALSAASTSADPTAVPAGAGDLAQLYETYIYDPMHAFDQKWIEGTTFLGDRTVHWDNALNAFWGDIGGKGILIGNGPMEYREIQTAAPVGCSSVTAVTAGTAPWSVKLAAPAASRTTATAARAVTASKAAWAVPVGTPTTA